jgi:hypothetical protein
MWSETQTDTASIHSAESAICMRYAAELDRAYYLNPLPSLLDRAKYYQRQDMLEQVRCRLYAALDAVRKANAK